jgi:hypothetical protein
MVRRTPSKSIETPDEEVRPDRGVADANHGSPSSRLREAATERNTCQWAFLCLNPNVIKETLT